jgi:glycosyltransferase involved in cell wall biosynthesis
MRESEVFLMTSHHGEGWGMVVNEAMSHGCCVLANRQLGSAKWLIEHGKNGFLYDQSSLTSVLDELAALGHDEVQALGQQAYQSMRTGWCSNEAARRTITLSQQLLTGDTAGARTLYSSGLCSWVPQASDQSV